MEAWWEDWHVDEYSDCCNDEINRYSLLIVHVMLLGFICVCVSVHNFLPRVLPIISDTAIPP